MLAICACQGPQHGLDGKAGMFSFTQERLAKRSDIRTGTAFRETIVRHSRRIQDKINRLTWCLSVNAQKNVVVSC